MTRVGKRDVKTSLLELEGLRYEYADIAGDPCASPLVFLHEGLGSVGLWRGFLGAVADATGRRAVAYSRAGHGNSDLPDRPRTTSFMHEEAFGLLPRLLERLGMADPVLVGHSDGASIALIHASQFPVRALVCIAPHVFVEPVTVASIRAALEAFEREGLRERMARHHRDPDACFYGWNSVWLDPEFQSWNIEKLLPKVYAPILLIQGSKDQYGTLAQVEAVARHVGASAERLVLSCGHSPHLECPAKTLNAVARFVRAH